VFAKFGHKRDRSKSFVMAGVKIRDMNQANHHDRFVIASEGVDDGI
jgi:hypothetical protein